MKLEQNETSILFSTTSIPDVFFTEYLSSASGDFIKVYLYLIFGLIAQYIIRKCNMTIFLNCLMFSNYGEKFSTKNVNITCEYCVKGEMKKIIRGNFFIWGHAGSQFN